MTIKNKKGFTLIELLVVIAIIGILSGLIIVSMGSANNSAKDARIQSSLDQIRTSIELYKINTGGGSYSTATITAQTDCTTKANTFLADADVLKLCGDIILQNGSSGTTIKIPAGTTTPASVYCIASDLNTGTGAWCIDYTGVSKAVTAITVCDALNYDCATE